MPDLAVITGASGLLGREVQRVFEERGWKTLGTALTRDSPPAIVKLDITEENQIETLLSEHKPKVIIHCAANRFPDKCAADPDAAHLLNATSTKTLAETALDHNAFFVYISTDYVFSGRKGEVPYRSNAKTSPPNDYGKTKLAGEAYTLEVVKKGLNAVVLRVPVLYGSLPSGQESQSAVNSLIPLIYKASMVKEDEDKIKMDHYAQRYPTNTADVGRICVDIAELYTKETEQVRPQILQFSGEERFTKWEMCQKLAGILSLPLNGMVPDVPKEGEGVQRPYDCHLDTHALKDLGIDVYCQPFEIWWRRELRAFRH